MKQYSVLLVDDEEEVFQIMMKKMDWEGMGFSIAGYARNGMEALEMAENLQPDVVMTDIKMPYMDGLTLSRKLKEMYENIRIIIFSGFDEFEYAKEAIKIEAEEYILKPINSSELQEVFSRVKNSLDKELCEKRSIEKLRRYYSESLPLIQESFYVSLLEGRADAKQLEKYESEYQIDMKGPYYAVTILHISSHENDDDEQQMESVLMTFSVQKYAEEQFSKNWRVKSFVYLGDIVLLCQMNGTESITAYTDAADRFCRMAKRVCNAEVTAGIGQVCSSVGQLPASFSGAQDALAYRVLYGRGKAISITETDPKENDGPGDIHWEEPIMTNILKQIKIGGRGCLGESIKEFTSGLTGSHVSLQQYRMIMMEFLAELYRFANDNNIQAEDVFGRDTDLYKRVLEMEPEQLEQWISSVCSDIQERISNERRDTTKSFVLRACEYVKENYSDKDMSTDTVCAHLNLSAAYFSTLFKKETGTTFINYLTDYRMERAEEMLTGDSEKTYIIAEKAGYADPNYFSYVFKKKFGVSPSKYRQEHTGTAAD